MSEKALPDSIRHFSLSLGLILSLLPAFLYALGQGAPAALITYTYQHDLLPKSNSTPVLTIFSDGSMRAVFPASMKHAGTHQGQLAADKLQTLRALLSKPTMKTYNAAAIADEIATRKALQEQITGQETLFAVLDSTTTIIEIPTQSGSGNEALPGNTGNTSIKKIIQKDLPVMAQKNPDIVALQDARELQKLLQNILDTTPWTNEGGQQ